jgi:hypothetical protein
MVDRLTLPLFEFASSAMVAIGYCYWKFPRSVIAGLCFIGCSILLISIHVTGLRMYFGEIFESELLATAAYPGLLCGFLVFGVASVLEAGVRRILRAIFQSESSGDRDVSPR